MSEYASIPFALLFGIVSVLLVRSRDVRAWQAVVITLFGIYLGQTPVVLTVDSVVTWTVSGFITS
ncbi:hypothetical protein [Streptomyces yaizuensis]|uniref:Uncharacterized protein n=1 Tax=Streptomyces yaizuensis TaxID=2989713 RepID=A0ABQ5NVA4_9ACTN|nr:hypothetical protein [Streptomyces sp. YSPA8]GLF94303.1 hypothetical protein SYYSPA8_08420 [Streptomyces sp. YSPA8]